MDEAFRAQKHGERLRHFVVFAFGVAGFFFVGFVVNEVGFGMHEFFIHFEHGNAFAGADFIGAGGAVYLAF
jgi:hypothetical protein